MYIYMHMYMHVYMCKINNVFYCLYNNRLTLATEVYLCTCNLMRSELSPVAFGFFLLRNIFPICKNAAILYLTIIRYSFESCKCSSSIAVNSLVFGEFSQQFKVCKNHKSGDKFCEIYTWAYVPIFTSIDYNNYMTLVS